jgi:hypothetical protein
MMSVDDDFEKMKKDLIDGNDNATTGSSDWGLTLADKYHNLHHVVLDNIPNLWAPLEFALSIKSILSIRDCSLPFAGIILGPPSSLKTAAIELFRGYHINTTPITLDQHHLYLIVPIRKRKNLKR